MEYVTLLQPAVLYGTIAAVLYQLARVLTRVEIDDPDLGTRKAFRAANTSRLKRAGIVGVAGFLAGAALVVTPPGHRGVVYSQNGGIQETERVEGLSFIIPILQSAIQMDIRTLLVEYELPLQTKDLQEVKVPVGVNYRVEPGLAAELYRDIGRDYAAVVIKPAVEQIVKAAVGQIKAVDFAQSRDQLAKDVGVTLGVELAARGIIIEFVSIEDAVFDPAFIQAVKNKVIADERASEQERLVAAAESEARQAVKKAEGTAAAILVEAEAQAEANQKIAESLTGDLLTWRQLERWNGVLPETLLGADPLGVILDIK